MKTNTFAITGLDQITDRTTGLESMTDSTTGLDPITDTKPTHRCVHAESFDAKYCYDQSEFFCPETALNDLVHAPLVDACAAIHTSRSSRDFCLCPYPMLSSLNYARFPHGTCCHPNHSWRARVCRTPAAIARATASHPRACLRTPTPAKVLHSHSTVGYGSSWPLNELVLGFRFAIACLSL